jgi:hypothetical protein
MEVCLTNSCHFQRDFKISMTRKLASSNPRLYAVTGATREWDESEARLKANRAPDRSAGCLYRIEINLSSR